MEFLLKNKTEEELYSYVKELPIVDYHNHLSLSDMMSEKRYLDICELWLAPDPYKHRAMRMCGIPEEYITGSAEPFEKFEKWCEVVPRLIGTPLYVWSSAELSDIFGIDDKICRENARLIYDKANRFLKENKVTYKWFFDRFKVKLACPCTSIDYDLEELPDDPRITPSLRTDSILSPTPDLIERLEMLTDISINSIDTYKRAISKRLDDFKSVGCVYVDSSLDSGFFYTGADAGKLFKRLIKGKSISPLYLNVIKSEIIRFIMCECGRLDMVALLHIGAERLIDSRLCREVGSAGGFACMGDGQIVSNVTELFCDVEAEGILPKTVLFNLNPAANASIAVLSGSYSRDGVEGLITHGPAWWWCDHKLGIELALDNLAAYGLLSNFVGMTTDSRSLLSFERHDYFRRVLCSFLSDKLKRGEYHADTEDIQALLFRMCCENAEKTLKKEKI